MSRRRVSQKRELIPDPRFGSETLARFVNMLMLSGKKSVAESVVYGALDQIQSKLGASVQSLDVMHKALDNVQPFVEVKSRRVGGATYQVPIEVRPSRRTALAMRWLISSAATRPDKTMGIRLANELLDAVEGRGAAIKKKLDVHKMAEANRAFSHYAW